MEEDKKINNIENENTYGGNFHDRDSLLENNIVDEIKSSFID